MTCEYDESDVEVLTPSLLIFGYRLESLHDEVIFTVDDNSEEISSLSKRYKCMIKLRNCFWNRWQNEYLTNFWEFHKENGKGTGSVVNIGDVVLVYNEELKRVFWELAIVERLVKGKHGILHGVSVRMVEKKR